MGTCIYCGNKAGFLKKLHKECELKFISGKYKLIDLVFNSITGDSNFDLLDQEVSNLAENNFIIDQELVTRQFIWGFDRAVNAFLEDGVLCVEEENKLSKFLDHYNFGQDKMDKNGSMQKIVKASILRDILDGKIPESKMNIQGSVSIMLGKSEYIIWIFNGVSYYEERIKTVYKGGSQGVSVRIAKGFYYRMGSFKGYPVRTEEMSFVANGSVVLTNENIYFLASNKNFKIPYNKILTIDSYEDGVGIQKDGPNTKPQVLRGLDGWFIYNFISNINKL